jgi:hypothetical protein
MIRQVKEEIRETDTLKVVENPGEGTKIDSSIQREVTEEQEVAIIIIGVEITSREVEEAQIIIGVTATIIEVITTEVAMVAMLVVTHKVKVVATATIIKGKKKIVITTTLPLIHWKETILKTTTINLLLDQK